jgi:hypothetical protein
MTSLRSALFLPFLGERLGSGPGASSNKRAPSPASAHRSPTQNLAPPVQGPPSVNNQQPTTNNQPPTNTPNISRIRNGRQHVHAASVEVTTKPVTVFSRIRSDFSHDATSPFCTDEPDPEAHPGSRTQAYARTAAQEAQAANAEAEADAPEAAAPRAQSLPGAEYQSLPGTVDAGPGTAGTLDRPGRRSGDAQSVTERWRAHRDERFRDPHVQILGSGSMMIL